MPSIAWHAQSHHHAFWQSHQYAFHCPPSHCPRLLAAPARVPLCASSTQITNFQGKMACPLITQLHLSECQAPIQELVLARMCRRDLCTEACAQTCTMYIFGQDTHLFPFASPFVKGQQRANIYRWWAWRRPGLGWLLVLCGHKHSPPHPSATILAYQAPTIMFSHAPTILFVWASSPKGLSSQNWLVVTEPGKCESHFLMCSSVFSSERNTSLYSSLLFQPLCHNLIQRSLVCTFLRPQS